MQTQFYNSNQLQSRYETKYGNKEFSYLIILTILKDKIGNNIQDAHMFIKYFYNLPLKNFTH